MDAAKRPISFIKVIVSAARLLVVAAVLVAVLPKVPLESANAHPEISIPILDSMAAESGNPTSTQIAASGRHTCALTPQGGVVCWGMNVAGDLGGGTTADSALPVRVNELQSGVMSLSLGEFRSCALTNQGRVYCWGAYADGTNSSPTPVEVNGLGGQVVQLAVGASHACVLTMAGGVLCWGNNTYGSLGNGTYTDSYTPVTAIASGAVQVASNNNYSSCAVMASGGVKCWGQGDRGQLGDGINNLSHNSNIPVNVLKTEGSQLAGAKKVVMGIVFACAQVSDGVYCWGVNRFGQLGTGTHDMLTHPYASPVLTALGAPALSGVDQLMAGDEYACVHLTGGNMKCWGLKNYGQLGDGSAIDPTHDVYSMSPVTVLNPAGAVPLTGVTQMAGGLGHTCVFTSWEEVHPYLCWGANYYGELGNGSTYDGISLPTPVKDISDLSSGVIKEGSTISTGGEHTCSINAGGGVSCWGNNAYGQLGNGSTSDSLEPVSVAGLSSEVKELALGQDHTCAILSNGQALCWGRNQHGQLGNGTTEGSLVPTYAALPDVSVTQLAVGDNHTCMLAEDGSVWCWGANDNGQLGNGTTEESPSPVTAIASGAGGIALGGSTSCALMVAGGVKCWGLGEVGQLGDGHSGTGYHQSIPTDTLTAASTPLSGASQITLGEDFACALIDDNVYCWGRNIIGQLGRGAASAFEVYAGLVLSSAGGPPLGGVIQISAGEAHACAHQYTDLVKCWGDNSKWQLGDGSSDPYSPVPHPVLDPEGETLAPSRLKFPLENINYLVRVSDLSADGKYTCAFFGWDNLHPFRCWGANSHGQLGDGTTQDQPYPRMIKDFLSFASPAVHNVVSGRYHSCALTAAGGAKCWGENFFGQLGDGSMTARSIPVQVSGLESGVVLLAAGEYHTCALTSLGGVKCWGNNGNGELGNETHVIGLTPVDVNGLTSGVKAITADGIHNCALLFTGEVKCWGKNWYGQLGDGTNEDSGTPVGVIGLTGGVVKIEAGGEHTCALTYLSGVKCWGYNNHGQLGNDSNTNSTVPVNVTGLSGGVSSLTAGGYHTCVRTFSGGAKCWGRNDWGELGDGTNLDKDTPVNVVGLETGTIDISAGPVATCASTSAGTVKCWGNNEEGQLGDASTDNHNSPVIVSGLEGSVKSIICGGYHTCATRSGASPLLCWGSNLAGQLGNGTLTSSLTPVISKWLASAALVQPQKTEIFLMTESESAIVVPAQAVPVDTVVEVTIADPPLPPPGSEVVNDVAFDLTWELSGLLDPLLFYNFPPLGNPPPHVTGLKASSEIQTVNLFYYEDDTWKPVLPCTGCSVDYVNNRLIANMAKEGIYAVMVSTTKNIFLPIILR